jgi:hypothetical protein
VTVSTYPRTGLQRILAGAPDPLLRATILDQDGDPVTTDVGTVTCTISRADGTVVATGRSATDSTSAVTCALTTAEAQTLDVLTAVWSVSGVVRHTSYHRVVGGFMFSTNDLATRPGVQSGHDLATLRTERDRITDLIESFCGAQSPVYDLEQWQGRGSTVHALHYRPVRAVRSVTVDGAAKDVADLEVDYAAGVVRGDVWFYDSCTLGYEHGLDNPAQDLRDAALTAAADALLRRANSAGPRVRSLTTDTGVTQQFSFAGAGHPTGIDEVDAVIMRHARPRGGIG